MTPPATTDVLIVGAGPTGLMLANQLARRGVRPLIVDRHPGPSLQTRALAVHARTLEIYAALGVAPRALELGTRATGANLWVEGRLTARVPLGDIGGDLSPFPYVLILGQDDNERRLGEALHQHGLAVHWNTELVAFERAADHAQATLRLADGALHRVTASWVAGCDGAHSAVRDLNAIPFPGAPYEHVFFVADTTVTGPMAPGELNVYLLRSGFHLFFPMRGPKGDANHWRVVGIVPAPLRDRDDLDFAAVAPSIRAEVGAALDFSDCHWFSTYRIHHRRAARFRDGRCFLLGDAAHIHSPVGGQGMNTGLQDAYNLAWKLALVVGRRAGEGLLDSYGSERVPVAERLLQTTDRAFSLIVSDGWLGALFRTRVLAWAVAFAMRRERARKFAFGTIAQIGINYRDGPLSRSLGDTPKDAPNPGDRFPWFQLRFSPDGPPEDLFHRLDDTRFNLIAIGQTATRAELSRLGDIVKLHQLPSDTLNESEFTRWKIPTPSFYLLRPDGHIGLAGTRLEDGVVTSYLLDVLKIDAF